MVQILLADNHVVVHGGLRNALENIPQNRIVGEVGDGAALEEFLACLRPDLLVVDLTMRNLSRSRRSNGKNPIPGTENSCRERL